MSWLVHLNDTAVDSCSQGGTPVRLVPNIRDMFSPDFLAGVDAVLGSFAGLQGYFANHSPEVVVGCHSRSAAILGPGNLGDAHVAGSGSPCLDFSPFGRRRGFTGPSMILFMLRAAMIQARHRCCVVFESVVQFPVQVFIDVLGRFTLCFYHCR